MKKPTKIVLPTQQVKIERRQANFYLPNNVLKLFRSLIPKRDQADVVANAIGRISRRKQIKRVIDTSRPKGKGYEPKEKTQIVLIDIDILIAFLKGNIKAIKVLDNLSDIYDVACLALTKPKIYEEMKTAKQAVVASLLKGMISFPVDDEIAHVADQYNQIFHKQHLSSYTCFMAATAKIYNVRIVTANRKRYPMKDIALDVVKL